MKLLLHPAALAELQDATTFYLAHAGAPLARAFIDEFDRVTCLLLANPGLGAGLRGDLRQYPLRRFPYLVIYQVSAEQLWVIAVAHQRRAPGYWKRRT